MLQEIVFLLLGGVVGWLTNAYFSKKADKNSSLQNHPLEERTDEVLFMLLENRIESRWGKPLKDVIHVTDIPKDTRTPHILRFFLTSKSLKRGEKVGILFRAADSEMNFGELKVFEVSGRVGIPAKQEGHGYFSCEVTFPDNLIPGKYSIQFDLKDFAGRENRHILSLDVD